MSNATILIVEDDHDISAANRAALELMGYCVIEANTLKKARTASKQYSPDLIILDVLMPDGSGLDYCEELRDRNGVRILFLSALGTTEDTLAGLRAGGDDYISKPYDMEELLLRVEALLRRGRLMGREEPEKLGGLTMDDTARRAMLNGRDLLLRPKEFALLALLMRSQGSAISAEELYVRVWGMDTAGDVRAVKEHISRIRSKLGENSGVAIVSERGRGYCLIQE